MKQATGTLLLLIAVSPLAVVAGAFATGIAFQNASGCLPGIGVLYGSLSLLVFYPGMIYRAAKLPLGLALFTGVLVITGVVLSMQSDFPPFVAAPSVNITMQPDTATPGAVDISGLSFIYPVILSRAAPGLKYQYQLDASAIPSVDLEPPPAHFGDNNGDAVDFTMVGANQIHIQDNRGGYVDIHWDGSQFLLDSTHSEGLSAAAAAAARAARGVHSNHHREWGTILTGIMLSLAWLFVNWFVIQWRIRMDQPFGSAVASAVLIIFGTAVAVWMSKDIFTPTEGDIPVGLPGALCSLFFCGIGFALWCWQLFSMANEMNRVALQQDLTDPSP